MELLALAGATYLAKDLFKAEPIQLQETPEELDATMLERPYDFNMHEMRRLGAIMPQFGATRGRVPWSTEFPPYYIAPDAAASGPNCAPAERVYTLLANAEEHNRLDVMEEAARGRHHYARKTGVPLWTGFTRDVTLHDPDPHVAPRNTGRLGFSWMPPNPTDSDWNEAGLIAKALPPNPTLFTPDSTYMTAPGQLFRHGAATTV